MLYVFLDRKNDHKGDKNQEKDPGEGMLRVGRTLHDVNAGKERVNDAKKTDNYHHRGAERPDGSARSASRKGRPVETFPLVDVRAWRGLQDTCAFDQAGGHLGGGEKVSAKLRGWYDYKNGDNVNVAFARKHFFDKETGVAIRKEENA